MHPSRLGRTGGVKGHTGGVKGHTGEVKGCPGEVKGHTGGVKTIVSERQNFRVSYRSLMTYIFGEVSLPRVF